MCRGTGGPRDGVKGYELASAAMAERTLTGRSADSRQIYPAPAWGRTGKAERLRCGRVEGDMNTIAGHWRRTLWIAAVALTTGGVPTAGARPRLVRWEMQFRGQVLEAAIGRKVAYYLLHVTNSRKDAPGRDSDREVLNTHGAYTDWRMAVVGVDLVTGRIRWSRRVHSRCDIVADPRNDDVHVYSDLCLTLRASDGEVVRKSAVLTPRGWLDGVIIGSRIWSAGGPNQVMSRRRTWRLVSPDTGKLVEIDVPSRLLLSPDEGSRLRIGGDGLTSVCTVDGKTRWRFECTPVQAYLYERMPIWAHGRIYWLNGAPRRRSEAICLGADDGKVVWRYRLSNGAYRSTDHSLRAGSRARKFASFSLEGGRIIAMDTNGRLHFLDAKTGEPAGQFHPSRTYLCSPAIRGDSLIVFTRDEVRSYPMENVLGDAGRSKMLAYARSALSRGDAAEALDVALETIRCGLGFASAYRLAAEALEELGRGGESPFFRAKALSLAGEGEDARLKTRVGLLRVVDLPEVAGEYCQRVDDMILIGARDGRVFAVDIHSLEKRVIGVADREIARLRPPGPEQVYWTISPFSERKMPLPAKPDEPPEPTDALWRRRTGYHGRSVYYRGAYYRPTPEGVVCWDPAAKASRLFKTCLAITRPHEKRWEIHLTPFGVNYGAGVGGVSILEANLCPSKWLVHLPAGTATRLACGETHFAGVFGEKGKPVELRIYNREGDLLRAAATAGVSSSGRDAGEPILRHAGGYLLCGMELLFLHPDPAVPVVRLARPGAEDTRTVIQGQPKRQNLFGKPIIAGDRVFTVCRGAGLFVFDADYFGRPCATGRAAPFGK